MFVFQSCCRAVRSADHFNNVESVVAEECTVAPTLDSSMMRSKSEIRILQKPIPQNYHGIVAKARPRSLFEASAIRVAKHSSNKRHMTGQPDTDNQGIPARFMDAYLAALRDSNVRYVNARNVSVTNRCQPKMVKVHTCMLSLYKGAWMMVVKLMGLFFFCNAIADGQANQKLQDYLQNMLVSLDRISKLQ